MATVGWWAADTPLLLANGYRFRTRGRRPQPITVSTEHRLRHLYVVGSSGSGKSRLCRSLICQDIDAGRGFTLLDPLDLEKEVLGYIAERALGPGKPTPQKIAELGDKLVIISPADQRWGCPGINLLEVGPGQLGFMVVDAMVEASKQLWGDIGFGARMEDLIRNSLLLLLEHRLTVAEIVPLLCDDAVRANLVRRCHNPDLKLYWEQFLSGLRVSELKTWFESTRNKFGAVLSSPLIRPLLGQSRTTINFRQVLDRGQWLVISLSQDRMKESGRLLGALLIILLHQAVLSREHTPPDLRTFHTLFIDEFQNYFSPTVLHLLEGARKFGLACCLLHQNLSQIPFDKNPAFIDTILANTHSRVFFSLSHRDATRLAGEVFYPTGQEVKHQDTWLFGIPQERPTTWSISDEMTHYANELQRQRQAEAFISFRGRADDEPYVATIPYVPDVTPDPEKVDILRRHVAARYYRPVAAVEAEIRARWEKLRQEPPPPPPAPRDYRR